MTASFEVTLPDRVWLPLYALNSTERIITKLKLQKLIFLIENEAKLTHHYNYEKRKYGPYSNELEIDMNVLDNWNLIESRIVSGSRYPYWIFKIEPEGIEFLNKLLHNINSMYVERVKKILDKYIDMDHNELVELVYEKYWFFDDVDIDSNIFITMKSLNSLITYFDSITNNENDVITDSLVYSEYCFKAIEKSKERNNLIKSIIINSTNELIDKLFNVAKICNIEKNITYDSWERRCESSDPDFYEIFHFIEYFCEKNQILSSIRNLDYADFITEEELKRLEKELLTKLKV